MAQKVHLNTLLMILYLFNDDDVIRPLCINDD